MYAQLVYIDGPRSAELVAASERAGRERILPAIAADPITSAAHVATYVLRQRDGSELVVSIADSEAALERANELISQTTLLPGEDPALLPGPDRMEIYEVIHAVGRDHRTLEVQS